MTTTAPAFLAEMPIQGDIETLHTDSSLRETSIRLLAMTRDYLEEEIDRRSGYDRDIVESDLSGTIQQIKECLAYLQSI